MPERRILILGAGVCQAPLIGRANERALQTIVFSTPGPWPGIAMADEFHSVDITRPEAVVAAARELAVEAVATAGTDHGLPALGALVDGDLHEVVVVHGSLLCRSLRPTIRLEVGARVGHVAPG